MIHSLVPYVGKRTVESAAARARAALHPLQMPPARKRARTTAADDASAADSPTVTLRGGTPEKPRLIAKYRAGKLTDVRLHSADSVAFDAHILCLMSGSDYFETLFSGEWSESDGGELSLPAVSAAALSACLEYIYTGACNVCGGDDGLAAVLEAAAYLHIDPLRDAAEQALSERLGLQNVLLVWGVADRQGLTHLAANATSTARRHFEALTLSDAWLCAPLAWVSTLLASDQLAVRDERAVYTATVAWLHAQAAPPDAADAAALLGLVRYPLLPESFFGETVLQEPLLQTAAAGRVMRQLHTYVRKTTATLRRGGFEKLYMLGGNNGSSHLDTVERFDPTSNSWEAVASMSTKRYSLAATVLDGKLYAMGGYDGSSRLDTVERFDPTSNSWEAVAPMSTKRRWSQVAVL